jgi:hypothetical protein
MTTPTETLERILVDDLSALGERLADDRLTQDLYRALANRALFKRGDEAEGHVALSWKRAEEIVNLARAANALPPKEGLAGSGGEGELSDRADEALEDVGWLSKPENTSRHDERHTQSAASPPPPDTGERHAPVEDSHAWERQAHAEAEAERLRRG